MARLQNKVALITGGCSGIGLRTAELFMAEGASVVVADILEKDGAELQERYSSNLRFIRCDVTREDDIAAAVNQAVSEFGGLDITFNNAGAVGTTDSIENMRTDNWDRAMNVLLRSVMLGIKHSAGPMKARGGGAIINTSSIAGISTAGPAAYCVAKAAVLQLSKLAALELAPHRIRVNSVLPGVILTPIFGNVAGLTHEQSKRVAEQMSDDARNFQPIPRAGSPSDIAEACLYLASDAAAFVTGAELLVDGGVTLSSPTDSNPEKPGSVGYVISKAAKKVAELAP